MRPLDDLTATIVDASVHGEQLMTYLKLTNLPGGLLINLAAAT